MGFVNKKVAKKDYKMARDDILALLQQAAQLDSTNDMLLKQAGSALMELIISEQPLAAIALLAALPDSVLYAPQKAGFGILYWTCNIPGPVSALVLKALYHARPELFVDFIAPSTTSPLLFSQSPRFTHLELADQAVPLLHPHEQESHPIYWTINLSNPHALTALLSLGVALQYQDIHLACSKAEGFCAIKMYEHCLFYYHQHGGTHPIEYIFNRYTYPSSAIEALEKRVETILPSSDVLRGASIALQYFYSQREAQKIDQALTLPRLCPHGSASVHTKRL